jgi:hypothetical protein
MKPNSRVVVFSGINFVTVPAPVISRQTFLAFQKSILDNGLEFVRTESPKDSIVLMRDTPYPLQVTVNLLQGQVGQLLIIAPQPKSSQEIFIQESEAAIHAYEEVWQAPNRQIIKADATIRNLYETTSPHAFKELWENRLGQQAKSLAAFGRPIRGGGLRFVMDPIPEDMPVSIEVKIESLLSDTSKILVETQFIWPMPTNPGTPFNVRERLTFIGSYIEKQVNDFLTGENKDD